jgi:hypothetical protein
MVCADQERHNCRTSAIRRRMGAYLGARRGLWPMENEAAAHHRVRVLTPASLHCDDGTACGRLFGQLSDDPMGLRASYLDSFRNA